MSIVTKYIKFQSTSKTVYSKDCTTRWPSTIKCNIPITGLYSNTGSEIDKKHTNLMVMIGEEIDLNKWLNDNIGKVKEISETEANTIGQTISPEGTTTEMEEYDNTEKKLITNTYVANKFTIKNGQLWLKRSTETISKSI